jgi:hypothetical protein
MKMPGASTLHELVNAVSHDTRELILRAQLADVLQEEWDDFEQLIQDSTAVKANAQWPKDSQLMVDLLSRLIRRGDKLQRFGLSNFQQPRAAKLLKQMSSLHKQISMGTGVARKDRAAAAQEGLPNALASCAPGARAGRAVGCAHTA